MAEPYVTLDSMVCGNLYVDASKHLHLAEHCNQLEKDLSTVKTAYLLAMEELAELKKPPTVYSRESGNGIIPRSGVYWKQYDDSGVIADCPYYKQAGEVIDKRIRYIKAETPTFPPLPKPPSPKPELKLYRVIDHKSQMIVDETFWGFKDKRGFVYPGGFEPCRVEEVKDADGKQSK